MGYTRVIDIIQYVKHIYKDSGKEVGSYYLGFTAYGLQETSMEGQKGPYKDYSPSKRWLYGFPY